jgi:hypothetical protein
LTHIDGDEPTSAVTTPNMLRRLAILLKMHIEMFLEVLFAGNIVAETNPAMCALRSESVVLCVHQSRTVPEIGIPVRWCLISVTEDNIPDDVNARQFHWPSENVLPVRSSCRFLLVHVLLGEVDRQLA